MLSHTCKYWECTVWSLMLILFEVHCGRILIVSLGVVSIRISTSLLRLISKLVEWVSTITCFSKGLSRGAEDRVPWQTDCLTPSLIFCTMEQTNKKVEKQNKKKFWDSLWDSFDYVHLAKTMQMFQNPNNCTLNPLIQAF